VHIECNKAEQEHFSQKKTQLKSACKNSCTFEGKNLPEKVTFGPLASSYSIASLTEIPVYTFIVI